MMSVAAAENGADLSRPCCYAALHLPLTKFAKSAAFISPNVHFITAGLRYAASHDRLPASSLLSCSSNANRREAMFTNTTHGFLCQSPLQEAFGENAVLICLVFGCNYQPELQPGLCFSSHIVSLLCFAFLICFFVPLSVF